MQRKAPRTLGSPRFGWLGNDRSLCRTPLAQRQGRLLVSGAAQLSFRENAVGSNPFERFLVDFLGIRLENQAFAGPPAPRIHSGVEAVRKLLLVIMGVELRP